MEFVRTDEITGLWSYLNTIDWSDPWFLGLAAFHLTCALATIVTRRNTTQQAVVFAFFLVIVACTEYINEFAATHWRRFSRQQYFDSNGLFISVVLSMPLLVNCLIIIVMWLRLSADLAGAIRRKQLRQARQQEQQANGDGSAQRQSTDSGSAQGKTTSNGDTRKDKKND